MGRYLFKLPDVGEGTAEAEIVAWHVAVGDTVTEDQTLVDVMTDKATVEIPSPVAGRILSVNGTPGAMLAVGSELVVLEVEGAGNAGAETTPTPETAPEAAPPPTPPTSTPPVAAAASALAGVATAPPTPPPAPAAEAVPVIARTPGTKPTASPAVRRRAWDLGVPLQFVAGSGPGGRVLHADLDRHLRTGGRPEAPGPAAHAQAHATSSYAARPGVTEIPVRGLRRRIAESLQETKRRIPHFSYIEEIDVTALEELRRHLNAQAGLSRPKLTLLPFLIRALARAVPEHPEVNALYDDADGVVRRFDALHAGIATQTPGGLMVPVIRHAETLDLWQAAAAIRTLADAARDGKATREQLSGSTITITSLGALGGLATTPIINQPEVAIVGVNRIVERPVVRGGAVAVRSMMNLSCSFDHRVVDGWNAAEFVQRLKGLLEQPATLFLETAA